MVVARRGILAIRCMEHTGLLEARRTGPATRSAAGATIAKGNVSFQLTSRKSYGTANSRDEALSQANPVALPAADHAH
jgi:hypothetical protein